MIKRKMTRPKGKRRMKTRQNEKEDNITKIQIQKDKNQTKDDIT
jgi:hypothetical protein